MKGKTFQIVHNCICTKENILVEGCEYLYREGPRKLKVILEKVNEDGEWLYLMVYFPAMGKRRELSHVYGNYNYSGMWRIFDWEESMEEEVAESEKAIAEMIRKFNHQPRLTKNHFIASLDESKLADILIHFNRIYDCRSLGEREMNMVWLAWLLGEGLLKVADQFIIFDMSEVEFNEKDYEITIESEVTGGVNLEVTRDFYDLDTLYWEVLKKD